MKWFVHYTVHEWGKPQKCVEGPYTEDEVIERRREIAKQYPDASVSELGHAIQTPQTS